MPARERERKRGREEESEREREGARKKERERDFWGTDTQVLCTMIPAVVIASVVFGLHSAAEAKVGDLADHA